MDPRRLTINWRGSSFLSKRHRAPSLRVTPLANAGIGENGKNTYLRSQVSQASRKRPGKEFPEPKKKEEEKNLRRKGREALTFGSRKNPPAL